MSFIPIGEKISRFNKKHLNSMETNLLPFLKGFCYFYHLQSPQDLTVQGTVQTWSRFLLEKIMLKQNPTGKLSKEGNKREMEARGRVVRCPKSNLSKNRLHLDSRVPRNHPRTKNRRSSFLCQSDTARNEKPHTRFALSWDLFGSFFVCQFRAKDVKDQTAGTDSLTPCVEAGGRPEKFS